MGDGCDLPITSRTVSFNAKVLSSSVSNGASLPVRETGIAGPPVGWKGPSGHAGGPGHSGSDAEEVSPPPRSPHTLKLPAGLALTLDPPTRPRVSHAPTRRAHEPLCTCCLCLASADRDPPESPFRSILGHLFLRNGHGTKTTKRMANAGQWRTGLCDCCAEPGQIVPCRLECLCMQ